MAELRRRGFVGFNVIDLQHAVSGLPMDVHQLAPPSPEQLDLLERGWRAGWEVEYPGEPVARPTRGAETDPGEGGAAMHLIRPDDPRRTECGLRAVHVPRASSLHLVTCAACLNGVFAIYCGGAIHVAQLRARLAAPPSWAAEHEHERLGVRTRAGLERARASGKVLGRPRELTDAALDRARQLRAEVPPRTWTGIGAVLEAEGLGRFSKGSLSRAVGRATP